MPEEKKVFRIKKEVLEYIVRYTKGEEGLENYRKDRQEIEEIAKRLGKDPDEVTMGEVIRDRESRKKTSKQYQHEYYLRVTKPKREKKRKEK